MLHIKMFISNAVQEIIQTNENGEFAGHVEIELPGISEASGSCCLVEGHNFSQLFEVEPKHCVVKMGITYEDLTNHRIAQNRDTGF